MSTFKIPDPTCIALREALPQVLDDYQSTLHTAMPTLDLSSWNFGSITHRITVKNDDELVTNLVSLVSSFLENGDCVELSEYYFKNGVAQFDVRLGYLVGTYDYDTRWLMVVTITNQIPFSDIATPIARRSDQTIIPEHGLRYIIDTIVDRDDLPSIDWGSYVTPLETPVDEELIDEEV